MRKRANVPCARSRYTKTAQGINNTYKASGELFCRLASVCEGFSGFFCVGRFRTVINEQVFNNRREGEHQRMKERGRELRMDISGQDADMINPRGQDLTG